ASTCSLSLRKEEYRGMPRLWAARARSSMCRIRKRSLSFCGGMNPRAWRGASWPVSIERAIALQLVQQIAHDIHVIGGDDKGAVGHTLDLAVVGISHAGQEIHQTAGDLLVGGLQIEHHRALVVQMVCDSACILEALGLDQHHLELGGG